MTWERTDSFPKNRGYILVPVLCPVINAQNFHFPTSFFSLRFRRVTFVVVPSHLTIQGCGGRLVGRVLSHVGSHGRVVVLALASRGDAAGATVAAITGITGITASITAVAKVLLAESCEALLLGDGVDVGTDDEGDEVEEGNPELVGEELLGKGQADGGGDPGDAHHLPEADLDGSANLVVSAGAGDEGHGDEVDAVLDGGNLRDR